MIGVRGFGRGIFEYPPTVGADLPKLRFFELEGSRLVVSNIKGWEGAVAVTSENEAGRVASNRFLTYATRGDVSLAYVAHYLLSDEGIRALGQASPGSADRNRTLSIKNFEAIEIPLPELPEQRRIAAHLDSVDSAAKRGLARAPVIEAKMLMRRIAAQEMSAMPVEWRSGIDFVVMGGATPAANEADMWNGQTPWVTPADIGPLHGRVISRGGRDVAEQFVPRRGLVPAGSVVMTSRAPIGNLAVAEADLLTNQGCKSIVPLRAIEPLFLYFSVMSRVDDYLAAGSGTTFHEVSASRVSAVPLPGAPPELQSNVAKRLARIEDKLYEAARRRSVGRQQLSAALPAARNEVFSAMR